MTKEEIQIVRRDTIQIIIDNLKKFEQNKYNEVIELLEILKTLV